MKKIICFSGGHSSALAAIETARKYGTEGMVLLNHDISPHVEHEDIKRFKREVAEYIGLTITYANMPGWETMPPLAVAVANKAFKAFNHPAFCTSRLKTEPFYKWLEENGERGDWVIYGFDAEETSRMMRRSTIMNAMGYQAVFPLADWERTIQATEEVGIRPLLLLRRGIQAACHRRDGAAAPRIHRPQHYGIKVKRNGMAWKSC